MKILLGKALLRAISWLPLWLAHALARPLGWLLRVLPWKKKKVVRRNLELCFSDRDEAWRESVFRQSMNSLAFLVAESGAVWHWPRERLLDHVPEVSGREHVEAALNRGKGLVLAGAHMGNWEILNLYCATLAPMIALYRAPADPGLDEFITGTRQRTGAELIPSGSFAMRRMIRQLRDGGMIGILCDHQPKQGEGVFAPFFGVPALTMTLVNRLASRTGCQVIMVSSRRLPGARGWHLYLEPGPEAIADPDPAVGCAAMNRALESQILRAPGDYLWLYKRFGIRPPGQSDLYGRSRASQRRKGRKEA